MDLSPESVAARVLIDTLLAMDHGERVQMAQTLLNEVDHHLLPWRIKYLWIVAAPTQERASFVANEIQHNCIQ